MMAEKAPSKPEPAAAGREPSFEQALTELEEIVAQLVAGEKPLDESLALYERGVAALKRCHEILDKAEKRIQTLVKTAGGDPDLRDAELPQRGTQAAAAAEAVNAESPGNPGQRKKKSARQQVDAEGGARQNPGTSADASARPNDVFPLRVSTEETRLSGKHAGENRPGRGGSLFGGTQ
jgi:exodeoxyribonuclease VII small subunit